jgi:hypothetical protein
LVATPDAPGRRAATPISSCHAGGSEVTHDWGLRLQWEVRRDGRIIATPPARAETSYEHLDKTPGHYEIVLQMWRYVNYRKRPDGEFIDSRFVDISNKVSFTI